MSVQLDDAIIIEYHLLGQTVNGIDYKDLSIFSQWQLMQMDATLNYLDPDYDREAGGCKLWKGEHSTKICPTAVDGSYLKKATGVYKFLGMFSTFEIVTPKLSNEYSPLKVTASV